MSETDGERETPEVGLVPDEDLPDDLNPEKNPLARDPGDEPDDGDGPGEAGPSVPGMPDVGQP